LRRTLNGAETPQNLKCGLARKRSCLSCPAHRDPFAAPGARYLRL